MYSKYESKISLLLTAQHDFQGTIKTNHDFISLKFVSNTFNEIRVEIYYSLR